MNKRRIRYPLLNQDNVSAGLSIKPGSSRGFLQRFSSSYLNRSIILPFSELMEHWNLDTTVFKFACTVRLLSRSCRYTSAVFHGEMHVTLKRVHCSCQWCFSDSLRQAKVGCIVSHFCNVFVEIWFLI